jgi:hypothetical protein
LTAPLNVIYTAAMFTAAITFHYEQSLCDLRDRRITRTHSNRRRKMITRHNKTQHFEKCFPYSSPKRSLDETGPTAQAHLTLSYSIRCNSLFPLFSQGVSIRRILSHFFGSTCIFSQKNEDPNGHIVAKSWGVSFLAPQSGRKTQTQGLKSGLQTYAMGVLPHCKVTPADTTTYELHFSGELAKRCRTSMPKPRFLRENAGWASKSTSRRDMTPKNREKKGTTRAKTKKKPMGS